MVKANRDIASFFECLQTAIAGRAGADYNALDGGTIYNGSPIKGIKLDSSTHVPFSPISTSLRFTDDAARSPASCPRGSPSPALFHPPTRGQSGQTYRL